MLVTYGDSQMRQKDRQKSPVFCCKKSSNFSIPGCHCNIACISVATTPNCTVDKMTAEASENVEYMCSATAVCGAISLTIMIEDDGNQVATAINSVTWSTTASNAANSAVTCMSTIQCPSVTITGELIAFFYLK